MINNLSTEAGESSNVHNGKLVSLFVICFIGSVFAGAVSALMAVYLPAVIQELHNNQSGMPANEISAYVNALFIFGWATGGFLWGLICDAIGRKAALLLAISNYGIFTILTGLSQNWTEIMICRYLSGFDIGGVLVVSFTLISEVWPARGRAVITGVLSIAFPVGIFSAGMINFFVPSWRMGFFTGAIPLLIAVPGFWCINESGLWQAERVEKRRSGGLFRSLFSAANSRALITGSVIFGAMLIGLWAVFSWLPTWIQSLTVPGANNKAGGISLMFLGMGGLSGGFFSGWMVNIIGLRRSLITCFAVSFLLSFILFKTNSSFSRLIYDETAVLALFFGASQGILSIYIPLLFPPGIRASATGVCFNTGRLFTAAAVFFIGSLVIVLGGYGNSLFIFSFVFLIGLLVVVLIKNINPINQ